MSPIGSARTRSIATVMGAELVTRPVGFAYRFGDKQLNVHGPGVKPAEVARLPVQPGNSDLCFEWSGPIADAIAHLGRCGVRVESGPMQRFGAKGAGTSVYFRDPDGSLMEFMSYAPEGPEMIRTAREMAEAHAFRMSAANPSADIPAGRRRRAASDRHEAAGPGVAGDQRRAGEPVEAQGPHGGLCLSAHRRARRRCAIRGWDQIPGARGCTPQSCGFRDHFANSRRSASPRFLACRRKTPPISRRPPIACICRFQSCPTKNLNLSDQLAPADVCRRRA